MSKTKLARIEKTGEVMTGPLPAFDDLAERFVCGLDVTPNSRSTYRRTVRPFLRWVAGRGAAPLTRADILAYKAELETRGLSALTRSGYLVAVRRFFEWLEAEKIYPNVAKGIKGAKRAHDHQRDALTIEQVKALLSGIDRGTADGLRDYAIVNLLLRAGLRTIEVVRADVGDLRQSSGEAVLRVHGKGRQSKDSQVLLTADALTPIMEYLAARSPAADDAPLFPSQSNQNRGDRLTPRTISRLVKDRLRAIGVDTRRLTAHSLRHTAVTFTLLAGGTLQEAMVFARHSDPKTTMVYVHNIERVRGRGERLLSDYLKSA